MTTPRAYSIRRYAVTPINFCFGSKSRSEDTLVNIGLLSSEAYNKPQVRAWVQFTQTGVDGRATVPAAVAWQLFRCGPEGRLGAAVAIPVEYTIPIQVKSIS
jgi:hypothetical protein